MNPGVLRAAAREALSRNHTPPQRYGTAFHITPPAVDVRDLDPSITQEASVSVWDETFNRLPRHYQQKIMDVDLTDVYVAWQLATMNTGQAHIIRVDPGQERNLLLDAGGLHWLFIGKEARVTIEQATVAHGLMIQRLIVWQEEKSQLSYIGLRSGITFLNEKIEVHLAGPEAVAAVTHLTYGSGQEQIDIEVRTYHEAPRTRSTLTTRAAAGGQSRTIYRGLIDVDHSAPATDGYQSARGLLLSRQAVIDALPELAIRTNDVRCSHGVTTTHLDELSLFYLRSRGLSSRQARQQALRGFFHHQIVIPDGVARHVENLLVHVVA